MNKYFWFLIYIIFISSTSVADDDFEFEDEIEFDATEIFEEKSEKKSALFDHSHRLSLSYQLGSTVDKSPEIRTNKFQVRYRWDKLLSNSLYAKVDAKIIGLGPEDTSVDSNKALDYDWRVNNMSLQWSHQSIATTVGFQSIVMGELDSLPLNDLMTPWDYSQPAFTNPEDARVGQITLDTQWFQKKNRSIRFIFIPIPEVNRYPGSDLTQLTPQLSNMKINETLPYEQTAWEAAFTAKQSLDAIDINFLFAMLHTNDPVFTSISDNERNATYPSFETTGLSINYNHENFLWKLEGNFQNNLPLSGTGNEISDKISVGGGFDYDANGLYQLTFESSYTELLNPPTFQLGQSSSTTQSALRFSKDLMNELINVVYFLSFNWKYNDQIHSAYANYKMTDNWQVSLNASVFHIPDKKSPMNFADSWDQVSLTITADF